MFLNSGMFVLLSNLRYIYLSVDSETAQIVFSVLIHLISFFVIFFNVFYGKEAASKTGWTNI